MKFQSLTNFNIIDNVLSSSCDIYLIDNGNIQISKKDKKMFNITFKNIEFEQGIYIFKINCIKSNNSELYISINNEDYELNNNENKINVYIMNNETGTIKIYGSYDENIYITNISISENINNVILTTHETTTYHETPIVNEEIKLIDNIESVKNYNSNLSNNYIKELQDFKNNTPIESINEDINKTYNNQTNIDTLNHPEVLMGVKQVTGNTQQTLPSSYNIPFKNIKHPYNRNNRKKIIFNYSSTPQPIYKNIPYLYIQIDKIYINHSNDILSNNIYLYFINNKFNNISIFKTTNKNINSEEQLKIFRYLNIVYDAKKNNYQHILIIDDNNIINTLKVFDSEDITFSKGILKIPFNYTENINYNGFVLSHNSPNYEIQLKLKKITELKNISSFILSQNIYSRFIEIFNNKSNINLDYLFNTFIQTTDIYQIDNNFIINTEYCKKYNESITLCFYLPENTDCDQFKKCIDSIFNLNYKQYIILIICHVNNNNNIHNLINNKHNIIVTYVNQNYKSIQHAVIQYKDYIFTKYMSFISISHIYQQNYLNLCMEQITENKPDFINCGYIDNNNNIINGCLYSPENFIYSESIQNIIVKTKLLDLFNITDKYEVAIYNFYKDLLFNTPIKKSYIFEPILIVDSFIKNIPNTISNIESDKEINNHLNDVIIDENINENIEEPIKEITQNSQNIIFNSSINDIKPYNNQNKINKYESNNINNNIHNNYQKLNITNSNNNKSIKSINSIYQKVIKKKQSENIINNQKLIIKNSVQSIDNDVINEIDDYQTNIKKIIDISKDNFIGFLTNSSIKNQRIFNICYSLKKYYNIIFISNNNIIEDNIIYITMDTIDKKSIQDIININKTFIIFNDIDMLTDVMRIKSENIIFDVVKIYDKESNKINQFNECIDLCNYIIYSNKRYKEYLVTYLKSINKNLNSLPIFISNNTNNEILNMDDVRPNEYKNIDENKRILCYVGEITKNINYNLIKYIADNLNVHIFMINITGKNKISFPHVNITWLNKSYHIQSYYTYIKYADICIFPYYENDKTLNYNPCELFTAIMFNKPIISTIDFTKNNNIPDTLEIKKDNMDWYTTLDKIIQELSCNIYYEYKYNDFGWERLGNEIFDILQSADNDYLNKTSENTIKSCMIITKLFNKSNDFIYGFNQHYMLNIADILNSKGVNTVFYQPSKNKNEINKFTYNENEYLINIISDYEINKLIKSYDYVIYDNVYIKYIKNNDNINDIIHKNSVFINHSLTNDNYINPLINNTILTITSNSLFSDVCNIFLKPDNNDINYIQSYYLNSDNKTEENPENDKLTILIMESNINKKKYTMIKEIINQIKSQNINITIAYNKLSPEIKNSFVSYSSADKRIKTVYIQSFNIIKTLYKTAHIAVFLNLSNNTNNIEYYTALKNNCIVVSSGLNGVHNIIIDEFNGFTIKCLKSNLFAYKINYIIKNYDEVYNKLKDNISLMIQYSDFNKWKNNIIDIFTNIGWIYSESQEELTNNIISLNRKDILADTLKYWKNYTHTYNLQGLYNIESIKNAVKNHIDLNSASVINICNHDKRICLLVDNIDISYYSFIIQEICKMMNVDVWYINTNNDSKKISRIKYYDFIYDEIELYNLENILPTDYNIVLYFNLNYIILEKLKKICNISCVQYISKFNDINDKYITNDFPNKIIVSTPILSNYLSYKFHVTPIIIPYPIIKYKKQDKNTFKHVIGCFTTFEQTDGLDVFIKALKRYKNEEHYLEEKFEIRIYYYNNIYSNSQYSAEIKNRIKEFDIDVKFIEIKKHIYFYINDIDLIVIPTLENDLINTLLYGLMADKDIIASACPSIREFNTITRTRGYNNLFNMFRTGDVNSLKNGIFNWWSNLSKTENNQNTNIDETDNNNIVYKLQMINANDSKNNKYINNDSKKTEYIKKYYSSELFNNKLANCINEL